MKTAKTIKKGESAHHAYSRRTRRKEGEREILLQGFDKTIESIFRLVCIHDLCPWMHTHETRFSILLVQTEMEMTCDLFLLFTRVYCFSHM